MQISLMTLSEEEVRQAVEVYVQARAPQVAYVSKVTPLRQKRKPLVYAVAVSTEEKTDAGRYPLAEEG